MLFHLGFLYTKKMADMKEQHACIKFCFTMGRNAMGKYELLYLLGKWAVGRTQVFVLFSKIKSSVSVEDDKQNR